MQDPATAPTLTNQLDVFPVRLVKLMFWIYLIQTRKLYFPLQPSKYKLSAYS